MSAQECINALRQGKLAPLLQWMQALPQETKYLCREGLSADVFNELIALNLMATDLNEKDLELIQRFSSIDLGIAWEAALVVAFLGACLVLFRVPAEDRRQLEKRFTQVQISHEFFSVRQELLSFTDKSSIEDELCIPKRDEFFAIGLAELRHSNQVKQEQVGQEQVGQEQVGQEQVGQEQVKRLKQLLANYQNHLRRLLAQEDLLTASGAVVELPAYGLQTKINIPSHWQVRHKKLAARYNAVVDCSNAITGSQSLTPQVKSQVRHLVTKCNGLQPSFSEKAFLDQLIEIVSKVLIFGFFVKTQEQRHQQQLTQACNPA